MIPLQFVGKYLTDLAAYEIDVDNVKVFRQMLIDNIPTKLEDISPLDNLLVRLTQESLEETTGVGEDITNVELMTEQEVTRTKKMVVRNFLSQCRTLIRCGLNGEFDLYAPMKYLNNEGAIPAERHLQLLMCDWRTFKDSIKEIDAGKVSSDMLGNKPVVAGNLDRIYKY